MSSAEWLRLVISHSCGKKRRMNVAPGSCGWNSWIPRSENPDLGSPAHWLRIEREMVVAVNAAPRGADYLLLPDGVVGFDVYAAPGFLLGPGFGGGGPEFVS